jgi:hypothetical protein
MTTVRLHERSVPQNVIACGQKPEAREEFTSCGKRIGSRRSRRLFLRAMLLYHTEGFGGSL